MLQFDDALVLMMRICDNMEVQIGNNVDTYIIYNVHKWS